MLMVFKVLIQAPNTDVYHVFIHMCISGEALDEKSTLESYQLSSHPLQWPRVRSNPTCSFTLFGNGLSHLVSYMCTPIQAALFFSCHYTAMFISCTHAAVEGLVGS